MHAAGETATAETKVFCFFSSEKKALPSLSSSARTLTLEKLVDPRTPPSGNAAPRDVPGLIAAARLARAAGQREASLAWLRTAIRLQPAHAGLRTEAAVDLAALGRTDEAEAEYRAVLHLHPGHPGAHVGLGHAARRRGDRQAALGHFQAAWDANPAQVQPGLEAAAELCQLGRVDDAEALYQAVLARSPGQPGALLGLATCARRRGDLTAALDLHRSVLAADPAHAWARLQAASDLCRLDRLDAAEAEYHHLLSAAPDSAAALLGLGQCARRRGDRAAALSWHRRAAAADPANTWCRLECAVDLRELGQFDAARDAIAAVLAQQPGSAPALLGLAQNERAAGRRAASRDTLRRLVAEAPGHVTALLELAADERELGDAEAARRLAQAALEADPAQDAAWLSLGHTERAAGRHDDALAAFARAHALQPGRAEPLLQMAQVERALGRQAVGDALLARALALEPDNPPALVQQAEQARMALDVPRMHATYAGAVARLPFHLGLHLGLAEALALLGRTDEALAQLAATEAASGQAAMVRTRRVGLLRRCGHWPDALALARQATADAPQDFGCWMERLSCELCLGTEADINHCLAHAPAATQRDRARLARMRARVAEDRGDWAQAASGYLQAESLDPEAAETYFMRTRFCLSTLDLPGARHALRAYMRLNAASLRLRGQSRHASQTHFGQVLDEYALDQAVADGLPALRGAAQQGGVEAVLQVVAAHPHSTAAAVALLHALRAQGLVGARLAGAGLAGAGPVGAGPVGAALAGAGLVGAALANSATLRVSGPAAGALPAAPIPARIVQFWDTPDVPADVRAMMQSWRDHHPDHLIELFDDAAARAFIARHLGAVAGNIYGRISGPAQKADVFRLAYLAIHGGAYADSDDRCHAPLHTVLPPRAELVLYQEDFGSAGNNFIACAPRHPVIVLALRQALAAAARGDAETVWLSTGPALLTRALAQHLAASGPHWRGCLDRLAILGRRELFGAVAIHCLTGYKATDRHWGNAAPGRGAGCRLPESGAAGTSEPSTAPHGTDENVK